MLSYRKSELLKKPPRQRTFWSSRSLAGDYWSHSCSKACSVMVRLQSCMVAVVASLNRLLQFWWKEHADSRSQSGGRGKDRTRLRDTTNKPHTPKTMAVKSQWQNNHLCHTSLREHRFKRCNQIHLLQELKKYGNRGSGYKYTLCHVLSQ